MANLEVHNSSRNNGSASLAKLLSNSNDTSRRWRFECPTNNGNNVSLHCCSLGFVLARRLISRDSGYVYTYGV